MLQIPLFLILFILFCRFLKKYVYVIKFNNLFFHGFWIFFHTQKGQSYFIVCVYVCVYLCMCVYNPQNFFFVLLWLNFHFSFCEFLVINFNVEREVGNHFYFHFLLYILDYSIAIIYFIYDSVGHFSFLYFQKCPEYFACLDFHMNIRNS